VFAVVSYVAYVSRRVLISRYTKYQKYQSIKNLSNDTKQFIYMLSPSTL
jgi:hypothetical protein